MRPPKKACEAIGILRACIGGLSKMSDIPVHDKDVFALIIAEELRNTVHIVERDLCKKDSQERKT